MQADSLGDGEEGCTCNLRLRDVLEEAQPSLLELTLKNYS